MALKDIWTNKIDGVSDIEANDINLLANHIIDLEENSGGGGSTLTIEEVLKEVESPTVVKDISNVVFAESTREVAVWSGEHIGDTNTSIIDFKLSIEVNGEQKIITKDTEGLDSFVITIQDVTNNTETSFNTLPYKLNFAVTMISTLSVVYQGTEYTVNSMDDVVVLGKNCDKIATTTEVLALIKENIPPSGDEVSY